MTTKTYTDAEVEAIEMVDAIAEFAAENGWKLDQRGLHAWAFGVFLKGEDKLQTHYAVDPDKHEDKFILNSKMVEFDDLRKVILGTCELAEGAVAAEQIEVTEHAVPPTSAAHSAAHQGEGEGVPPTVPPTEEDAASAAHQRDDAAHDAQADLDDAAHPPRHGMPPTEDKSYQIKLEAEATSKAAQSIDEDERMAIGRELTGHVKDAERQSTGEGDIVLSHTQTQRAILGQFVTEVNWSDAVSHLSSKEILRMANGSEVTWRNRLSGSVEKATVSAKNKTNHPPRITPEHFEPEDDDLRILHFLELGGGFRSVAVATILSIG